MVVNVIMINLNASSNKVSELVRQARSRLGNPEPDRESLWRAYVALEYAILDLKLRYNLEEPTPRVRMSRKKAEDSQLLEVKSKLDLINPSSDKKVLLHDLRICRDLLKALVAEHDKNRS